MNYPIYAWNEVGRVAVIRNATYEHAIDVYLNANDDWLGDDQTPLVTALFILAQKLDKESNSAKGVTVGLTMEYRMLFVELHKHKPVEDGEAKKDGLDAVLEKIFAGEDDAGA